MAFSDVWNKTLVYFGIAEEDDEEWDEDGYLTNEELERSYGERPNVRRLSPRGSRRRAEFDDWTDPDPETERTATIRPAATRLRSADALAAILLFDAIDAVQSFVEVFVYVYVLLTFAYIRTSWFRLPYSPWLNR